MKHWQTFIQTCRTSPEDDLHAIPSNMKITEALIESAYKVARNHYNSRGTMRITDARNELVALGVKASSAMDMIYNLKHLLNGDRYERNLSVLATEIYFLRIEKDYGHDALKNAVTALRKHITYYQKLSRTPMKGQVKILAHFEERIANKKFKNPGLNDLDIPEGTDTPDRALTSGWTVIRDPKVRAYVIKKSKGMCEYCGRLGFKLKSGRFYVEAHHIIALANQGKDKIDNVIALCPEHHREAHFGLEAEALEQKFIACVQSRNGSS